MLHKMLRISNKFLYALYYDELVEDETYQISYLKEADRPYFNCAHAVNSLDDCVFGSVENYFIKKQTNPAFYIDSECPKKLKDVLVNRGYHELEKELENWYMLDCRKPDVFRGIEEKVQVFQTQNSLSECILFSPMTQTNLLEKFLELDVQVNAINKIIFEKLKKNLMAPKLSGLQFFCALVSENNIPASIGLIAFMDGDAFLAEGATHPNFRRRGFYTWLSQVFLLFAARQGCKRIIVNCDYDAYSNNTYKRLGFESICQRQFFTKDLFKN